MRVSRRPSSTASTWTALSLATVSSSGDGEPSARPRPDRGPAAGPALTVSIPGEGDIAARLQVVSRRPELAVVPLHAAVRVPAGGREAGPCGAPTGTHRYLPAPIGPHRYSQIHVAVHVPRRQQLPLRVQRDGVGRCLQADVVGGVPELRLRGRLLRAGWSAVR